ncbi:MAG TPA: nitroreductase/quinone reductase family protein, partial [Acidimicrobiia bacterium]
MTPEEKVYDSPRGWVSRHISQYVETDGRKGHRWQGVPTLLLTTRGRKSGKLRRTALIYGGDGDRYLVVASTGGAPA